MAGIAGIARPGKRNVVENMLEKIAHRGKAGSNIITGKGSTLGVVWSQADPGATSTDSGYIIARDSHNRLPLDASALAADWGPFAMAADTDEGIFLARGLFGVRPLYYGYSEHGELCFASEVKALREMTRDVKEFPTGSWFGQQSGFQTYRAIEAGPQLQDPPDRVVQDLRLRLDLAVCRRIRGEVMGSWLSGGLDSSVMAALARPHLRTLHTFAGGLPGAPDLEYARQVARALQCEHHEILLTEEELLQALPEVIYILESFDALLVRSTIVNYLVSRRAADWVSAVFSGEGGDELFAGYAYLEAIPDEHLSSELLDLTHRLHNTALQRVDRSASAHGLIPHVPFLDTEVASYVMRIPASLKRGPHNARIEKWILRKALEDRLPETVVWRKKAKFWEGAGVGEILSQHAEASISDQDFTAERRLPNGWELNTKEELMYYRIFRAHYGELEDLSWMGRTKGAPRHGMRPVRQ